MRKAAGWTAAGGAAYFALLPLLFAGINLGLPLWLERLLLLLAAPGVMLMLPWLPLLRRLGLSQGEWLQAPDPLAYIALAALYCLLLAGAAGLISAWRSR
ncbi:MAG: hypothetical protein ACOVLH_07155 [Roseateles sp.]